MTDFASLGLAGQLLAALEAQKFTTPTPIQAKAIPPALAGRDVLGLAQTGTGKTAAFALPILQRLAATPARPAPRMPRALVLAPTRELAIQIGDAFGDFGRGLGLRPVTVFGGVGVEPQARALTRGTPILVATPGRLLDLIGQNKVSLAAVEIFVLDEADRMLDMGFIRDVRKIVGMVPAKRQTMLFSATLPDAVTDLAGSLLRDPQRVEVAPPATTVERVEQRVLFVERQDKRALLKALLASPAVKRAIVFTRTKHGANRVADFLADAGIASEAIHGNKSQNARQRALEGFRDGRVRALVATDIAARGIDVEQVSHVVNFELPVEPEGYVHRIGRTARAGRDGIALTFCDADELPQLRAIERAIRQPVPVDADHPYHAAGIASRRGGQPGRGPAPRQPRPAAAASRPQRVRSRSGRGGERQAAAR
jgi:ATP-dependent RNA helicase RhlE